ncbi:hypothetical protein VKT23_017075 [Stygiomarasmius scandens]|uniref:CxC2-like cysteine cluster KDZ transposase-associated domain-containing protein n=1 Tax=Marasmiellus scandens TaxID=2682957 RepID=A0ABR1IWI5_9AGAR
MGLFPASYKNPQTVFTERLLKYHHVLAMECKVASNGFCSFLKRVTDRDCPEDVEDRYAEFHRAARCWSDLMCRMEGGELHDPEVASRPGGLAVFCSMCPQPGINLVMEQNDPDWLKSFSLVGDGNFKQEHMKMRGDPDQDVRLADGTRFMVASKPFKEYLSRTPNRSKNRKKRTCVNHRAQTQQNRHKPHLDITGIGVWACARHGCFLPHSMVDFIKGEEQRIMDWGVSWALRVIKGWNEGNQDAIEIVNLIYDIMCQYSVHFKSRLTQNEDLCFPEDLKLQYFIGKFHLGCHKAECYVQFTLDLLKGGGRIDGEVLETLWSELNKAKGATRAMSIARRQEHLDDLLQDSNFKKLTGGEDSALLRKYTRAKKEEQDARENYEDLRDRLPLSLLQVWDRDAGNAISSRDPSHLKIYEMENINGKGFAEARTELWSQCVESGRKGTADIKLLMDAMSLESEQ